MCQPHLPSNNPLATSSAIPKKKIKKICQVTLLYKKDLIYC
ncbi:hypothetical protein SSIN_1855 [Streptococcus sinensis]|uniref:Uncharacterized protein n=1 Tax=Streptococcus sinensis TaxID=176090 RepID=A0A0A0DCK5_9STRE|nr:hypothetical protein SSIN_1855 [Streptococcus sinensis]